ncbi:MAG: hypothetical protein UHS47_04480 [Oscillospiraceae bacterium]|nr:hypothetical protein [Oscillospiraceae bacterium]
MEYQISNEVSEFWYELVPPVFLGALSIMCFLWVVGKENRFRLMKRFVEGKDNIFVEENGILIPKNETIRYCFYKKLVKYTGLDSIRPLAAIFFSLLFFYGLNNTLLHMFQPLLTVYPSGILYAAGVDEGTIATIWMHYPSASISDLYSIIINLSEVPNTRPVELLDSVQVFIRFDLLCCLVLFILLVCKYRRVNSDKSVYTRLLIYICILFLLLVCTLLAEIHQYNNEIKQICYQAASLVEQNNTSYSGVVFSENYQHFCDLVQQDKLRAEKYLFYGAYGIANRYAEAWNYIVSTYKDLCRYWHYRTNNLFFAII